MDEAPADLLRRAAQHIRYLAGPPAEWEMDSDDWVTFEVYEDQPKGFRRLIGRSRRPVRALHVAAWDSKAAHAVADWLEEESDRIDEDTPHTEYRHPVTVARALLKNT